MPDSHPLSVGSTLPLPADPGAAAQRRRGDRRRHRAGRDRLLDRPPADHRQADPHRHRPRQLIRDYPPDVAILADAGAALDARCGRRSGGARQAGIDRAELGALRDAQPAGALPPLQQKHAKVLDALRAALPADGIVVTDMTQIAYTGCYYFPLRAAALLVPSARATARWAMRCRPPSAPSSRHPSGPRSRVAGDAGFLFTVQELATAVELKLPIADPALEQRRPRPDRRATWSTAASPKSASSRATPISWRSARPSAAAPCEPTSLGRFSREIEPSLCGRRADPDRGARGLGVPRLSAVALASNPSRAQRSGTGVGFWAWVLE